MPILRSLNHTSNDQWHRRYDWTHRIGLRSHKPQRTSITGQVRATHGSIAAKVLGLNATMPRFVTVGGFLHQGKTPHYREDAAGLGAFFDPFRCDYDPDEGVKLPALKLIDGSRRVASSRESTCGPHSMSCGTWPSRPAVDRLDRYYSERTRLLTSDQARQVFDLSREPGVLRDRYGRFRFGQCCLLAPPAGRSRASIRAG